MTPPPHLSVVVRSLQLSALTAAILATFSVASAQIFVTSTAGSGPGTLKDAIDQANLIPVADEETVTIDLLPIQLAAAPARAVVNLSNSLFPNRSIYLTATGGPLKPHIFFQSREAISILTQPRPTAMIFQNLRFEGARNKGNFGGAIRCSSGSNPLNLEIDHCEFVDNQISPDPLTLPEKSGLGGAVYFSSSLPAYPGTLKLKHCLFENNQALSNRVPGQYRAEGSAVFVRDSHVLVEDCEFTDNLATSGAAFSAGGALVIKGSPSVAEVRRCSFLGNSGGTEGTSGLICETDPIPNLDSNAVSLLLEDSIFDGNQGLALLLADSGNNPTASATVRNTTFVNNTGNRNSALWTYLDYGNVNLTHCTFWNNSHTQDSGAAIWINSSGNLATFSRCVIAGNKCSAVSQAINTSPDVRQYSAGSDKLVSAGYNFIGDAGPYATVFTAAGDRSGTRAAPLLPRLADVGNYGGPTRSCPPLPDSPLVDAIPNAANVLPADQLGLTRPQGFTADIGAVELPRLSYDVWDDQIPLASDRGTKKDPDSDGLDNRQEYFFGTDPIVANAAPVSIVENEDGRFLEVIRSATVRPLFFSRTVVETSTDLTSGSWSTPAGTSISSPEIEGSLDRIRTLYPVGTDIRRFFRVAVD